MGDCGAPAPWHLRDLARRLRRRAALRLADPPRPHHPPPIGVAAVAVMKYPRRSFSATSPSLLRIGQYSTRSSSTVIGPQPDREGFDLGLAAGSASRHESSATIAAAF